ncbi:T9SS type A sorting domain-containing protein, partial [candidate division WOR-3 bacterium]|nr:T9SS type A sorting domain-containing protein [candidate division WOR-3 bacterium]
GNIYVAGNNSSNGFITIMYENQQGIVSNDRTIDNNNVKIKQTGKGKINISFTTTPQNDYSISIYNLTGSLIKTISTSEINNGNITVENLTPGIYMLRYKVGSLERENKFVILP